MVLSVPSTVSLVAGDELGAVLLPVTLDLPASVEATKLLNNPERTRPCFQVLRAFAVGVVVFSRKPLGRSFDRFFGLFVFGFLMIVVGSSTASDGLTVLAANNGALESFLGLP